jgi:hypothetical protein
MVERRRRKKNDLSDFLSRLRERVGVGGEGATES